MKVNAGKQNRIFSKFITVKLDIKHGKGYLVYKKRHIGDCVWDTDNMKVVYLRSFGINDQYQDKGYGHFFASVILALFKSLRVRQVYLIDAASDDNFWESLGFKDGTKQNGYKYLSLYK